MLGQPNLKHYQEFKEILDSYQVSDSAKEVLENLNLVLLIGPTSAGRNTIMEHQIRVGRYYTIVSDTTREPRTNDGVLEQNGKEYWFRSEEDILNDLKAGEYLEAEIIHNQQVSGISIRELQKARNEQKIAVTDIDLKGLHNVLKIKPDALPIMLVPPSFEEWQRRLAKRGKMRPDERKRRLETAQRIFEDGLKQDYYHFVISENTGQSAGIIDAIVDGKLNPHQGRGKDVIRHLQSALQEELANIF